MSPVADLAVTGKVDAAGNLTLTAPISGGIATIAVNVSPVPYPILSGSYQVVGGACAQTSVAIDAFEVANVTGTYIGTMTQVIPMSTGTAPEASVTAVLVQSTTPNMDGQYLLTGTVSATGACTATIAFSQGVVYGAQVQSFPSGQIVDIASNSFTGSAIASMPLQAIVGTLFQPAGCTGVIYSGVLKRQ